MKACGYVIAISMTLAIAVSGYGQIGSGPGFDSPLAIAVEADGSLVVADSDLEAVVRVDPVSGDRTILSDANTGSGPDFETPAGLAVEADGNLVVVDLGLLAVVRVDPANGDLTILSDAGTGSGPDFGIPRGIAVEAGGNLVVVDLGLDAVVGVDPVSGDRAILSDAGIGSGPDFETPRGLAVEADGSLVVVDSDLKAVVRVDPVTGDRTILSDANTGSGPDFDFPVSLAVEANGNLVVVDLGPLAVVRVDPVTGDRTILSDAGTGSGPAFESPLGIAVEADGSLVVIDIELGPVVRVDAVTGDRTIIDMMPPAPEPDDFDNVFFMSLSEGLNMISLPLKPRTPLNARSFADELSSTMVVKYDETRRRFVGFTLDAPGNGFAIEGGKGYIVNVTEDETVTFTGAAWTNEPPVEAAPPLAVGSPDSAWAFVVSGRIDGGQASTAQDASFVRGSFYVTVRNTRTGAVATDEIRTGYFAAAFADLSRQSVVEVGDRLEVTVMDQTGEIASDPIQITVTAETLRQAFVPITLTGVGKPSQSQLLQNYPNPFNPETWLPYQLADAAKVTIQIYDSSGRVVRTLDLGLKPAGFYTRRFTATYWDGRNGTGERVASGVYFYTLQTDNPLQTEKFAATRKMLIAK